MLVPLRTRCRTLSQHVLMSVFLSGAGMMGGQALANADEAALKMQVLAVEGQVSFNNIVVKKGDLLDSSGTLTTGAASAAKLYIRESRTLAIIMEKSSLEFTPAKKKAPPGYRLLEGVSRWVVGKLKPGQTVEVTTRSAVMTVRGTEFMASYNKILNESEMVCFDGIVELKDKDLPGKKSRALVKKNHWSGIGGRFADGSGKIVELTPPVIEHFKSQTKVDSQLEESTSSAEFHGHAVPP